MSRHSAKQKVKRAGARATGPSVNATSIELALIMFMSMHRNGEEKKKRLSLLETEITQHQGMSALDDLMKAGCDREKVLVSLALSCGRPVSFAYDGWFTKPGPLSIETLYGLESRDFTTLKESLMEAAESIDFINRRFEFGVLLTTPHLKLFQPLPRFLQGYVSLLDLAADRLRKGTHVYHNLGKAILILSVEHQTGRSYEPQVCTLIGALLGRPYDVIEHRDWIRDHKDLLDHVKDFIPIFLSKDPVSLVRSSFEK
jgi:hypothetical protein